MPMRLTTARAGVLAVALACAAFGACAGDYVLKRRIPLGGGDGWDYLTYEPTSNRLFITRATRVQVVNPDTGAVIAEIQDAPGVHGVALATALGKGYTSNGRDDSISVFDLNTLRVIKQVGTPDGKNPDFIIYEAVSKRVLAFNARSHNASVIDAATDTLVASITLNGKPEAAVVDGHGSVFVDIEDTGEVSAIDAASAKVTRTMQLDGCTEPAGLGMDPERRRLFVGCRNKTMLIIDADRGTKMASVPIGEGVDATVFDVATERVYSSQSDGTLTVVTAQANGTFGVLQTAETQAGARTMAVNPINHDIYLVSAEFDEPAASASAPKARKTIKPGTVVLLVMHQPLR